MEKECIGNKWVKFNTRLFVININLLNFLFSLMPEMNMVKIESMNNWVAFLPIYCVSYFAFFHLLCRIRKALNRSSIKLQYIHYRPWQIAYVCTLRTRNHKFYKLPFLQVRSRIPLFRFPSTWSNIKETYIYLTKICTSDF